MRHPPMDADTRWHYNLSLLEGGLRSLDAMDDVYNAVHKDRISPKLLLPAEIQRILRKDTFWKELHPGCLWKCH